MAESTHRLEVRGLSAWYGEAQVLRDVDLTVGHGEVVTLVGRNGAGKTTLLRCVMGLHRRASAAPSCSTAPTSTRLTPTTAGPARPGLGARRPRHLRHAVGRRRTSLLPPVVRPDVGLVARAGLRGVPGAARAPDFPGTRLSGGEQQMLAMARVLRMGARLLLLDEPTEGLAPVHRAAGRRDHPHQVKAQGTSVLLVEQNLTFAATVADRHYLLAQGRVVEALDNDEFRARREPSCSTYLGM